MIRATRLCLIIVAFSFVSCWATSPQVIDTRNMGVADSTLTAIREQLTRLHQLLTFHPLASWKHLEEGSWTSQDFAWYTAGVLSWEGYQTEVVSSSGRTWILVRLPVDSVEEVWIPIEPQPANGALQRDLGRVVRTEGSGVELWFSDDYASYTEALTPKPNFSPIVRLNPIVPSPAPGERTRITASGTRDPDGEIVVFLWNFSDGSKRERTESWYVRHTYDEVGTYELTLTAVDNRGHVSELTLTVLVATPEGAEDCGCGG